MKKTLAVLVIVVCVLFSVAAVSVGEEVRFVTIREWMDARGECGNCMLVVRIQTILNPVLAIAEDETGTVNLFSGNGPDTMIVNFMGDEGVTEDCVLVIANPRWNEYEGTVEMADWTVLRLLPVLSAEAEE